MEEIKITLSNGTVLDNLGLNGNNYITQEEITEETFADGLAPVIINDEEHPQMELVQIQEHDDGRWFILRDVSAAEIADAKLRADIEYLAMMSDIELDN